MDNQEIRHPEGTNRGSVGGAPGARRDMSLRGRRRVAALGRDRDRRRGFAARLDASRIRTAGNWSELPSPPSSTGDEFPPQPRLEPFEPQLPAAESYAADVRTNRRAQLHRLWRSEDGDIRAYPDRKSHPARGQAIAVQKAMIPRSRSSQPLVSGEANSGRVFGGGEDNSGRILRGESSMRGCPSKRGLFSCMFSQRRF